MPRIPTYESNTGIKVLPSPGLGLGSINKSAQAQDEVVKTVEQAEDVYVKVRDFRQQAEAQNYVFDKLNEIKSLADQDADFDSSKYETEIDKVGQEAANTISGKLAGEEFLLNFQKQSSALKWGIRNLFKEKELDTARASIEYNRQNIINNYANMNSAEKITAISNFKNMLSGSVKSGISTIDEADQLDMKFQEDIQKSVVNNDIITNPDMAEKELKEGKHGMYPGISDQFRIEAIEKAKAYSKKYTAENEAGRKRKINDNENEVVSRMINPGKQFPTEGEIISLMDNKDINPKFAKEVITNIRSAKKTKIIPEKKHSAAFNDMVDIILNQPDFANTEDIRIKLIQENAKGILPDDEFRMLYMFNHQVTGDLMDEGLPKRKFLQSLDSWHKEYAGAQTESKARMFKSYMKKIEAGTDSAIAVDEAIKEEVKILHPQSASYPKEGKKVIDINGIFKRIFPTGEIKDEEGRIMTNAI